MTPQQLYNLHRHHVTRDTPEVWANLELAYRLLIVGELSWETVMHLMHESRSVVMSLAQMHSFKALGTDYNATISEMRAAWAKYKQDHITQALKGVAA